MENSVVLSKNKKKTKIVFNTKVIKDFIFPIDEDSKKNYRYFVKTIFLLSHFNYL